MYLPPPTAQLQAESAHSSPCTSDRQGELVTETTRGMLAGKEAPWQAIPVVAPRSAHASSDSSHGCAGSGPGRRPMALHSDRPPPLHRLTLRTVLQQDSRRGAGPRKPGKHSL